jgi:hypothetical protein
MRQKCYLTEQCCVSEQGPSSLIWNFEIEEQYWMAVLILQRVLATGQLVVKRMMLQKVMKLYKKQQLK